MVISDYYPEVNATWFASLRDHYRDVRIDTFPATFDDRRSNYEGTRRASVTCWRQRLELPVDHFGNVHLCCQDWRGAVPIGNVKVAPLSEILRRPVNVRVFEGLCAGTLDAPPVCATCTSPISRETYLDLCSGFVAP